MESFIFPFIEQYGYIAILLLIAIENIFPPIPSEVILLFSGFIATTLDLNLYIIILMATLGALLGALLLYYIGYILNKEKLKSLTNGKVGKIIKLKQEDIDRADNWFQKQGYKAVFIARFIPIVRSLISIPAGMSKMNLLRFLGYSVGAIFIWNSILVFVGDIVGENWLKVAEFLGGYSSIVAIVMAIIIVSLLIYLFYKRKIINKKGA